MEIKDLIIGLAILSLVSIAFLTILAPFQLTYGGALNESKYELLNKYNETATFTSDYESDALDNATTSATTSSDLAIFSQQQWGALKNIRNTPAIWRTIFGGVFDDLGIAWALPYVYFIIAVMLIFMLIWLFWRFRQ